MRAETLEALVWIDEAAELLDQAVSNLRTVGLDQEQCSGFRKANCRQLREDVESLAQNIRTAVKDGQ